MVLFINICWNPRSNNLRGDSGRDKHGCECWNGFMIHGYMDTWNWMGPFWKERNQVCLVWERINTSVAKWLTLFVCFLFSMPPTCTANTHKSFFYFCLYIYMFFFSKCIVDNFFFLLHSFYNFRWLRFGEILFYKLQLVLNIKIHSLCHEI